MVYYGNHGLLNFICYPFISQNQKQISSNCEAFYTVNILEKKCILCYHIQIEASKAHPICLLSKVLKGAIIRLCLFFRILPRGYLQNQCSCCSLCSSLLTVIFIKLESSYELQNMNMGLCFGFVNTSQAKQC